MVKNGCGQSGHRTRQIGSILKMNSWIELIFCMLLQIQESKKLIQCFLDCCIKNGHGLLVQETPKSVS